MDQLANSKLAHTLQKRMKKIYEHDSTVYTDLGTIKINNGLKLDNFDPVIPSSGYSKCSHVQNNGLKKGDRVLVVWANGEPVVVDKIV